MTVRIQHDEKNLAFARQPKPLVLAEAERALKPAKAAKPLRAAEVALDLFLPTAGAPKVELQQAREAGAGVSLRVANFQVGRHVFPPPMQHKPFAPLGNRSKEFASALQLEGTRPAHLDFRPVPQPVPKELQVPPFYQAVGEKEPAGRQATTIFAPDDRRVFHDTSFPWSCFGRVDSANGFGSGVMVGPRHLLTVSHVIQWLPNNQAGWVRFRPAYFDGSAPFGEAWGSWVYSKYKVSGPTIDWIEGMYDYVCVVLNTPIGNLTGWIGSRGYTDAWDGGAYWAHIGYPGDLTGGNRPTYQSGVSLDGAWWEFDSHEAMSHHADVWPGQSGGPFFGWWANEPWPRAVAVQSSQSSGENDASGGQDMVDLVVHARADHP